MCKLEKEMVEAIRNFKPWSKDNTCFHRKSESDSEWELVLHGHVIATFDSQRKYRTIPSYISLCGWPTKTTFSRLNCLEGVDLHKKNGTIFLNGREIESLGFWSPMNVNC